MQSYDLGLLVSLDALLQEGSVTGAAKRVGLSTPAMSHALARMRERLGDPLLVRAGRGMLLTPRALALKPQVHQVVADARRALEPVRPFVARDLARTFVVHATDYVLTVLGAACDRILREESPKVCVRFVPNTQDDSAMLRDQGSDLAVGIYGDLPPEMRTRQLLTDRFVCVVRDEHPSLASRWDLEAFVAWPHIQIAPRGRPGGYIDDVLAERGMARNVARAVPYFGAALQLVAQTDYVLVVSERLARLFAPQLGLQLREVPLPLRPYALALVWHPRHDGDPAHRYVRDGLVRAATACAAERHPSPRVRLDPTDPTAGGGPRRRTRPPKLHETKE